MPEAWDRDRGDPRSDGILAVPLGDGDPGARRPRRARSTSRWMPRASTPTWAARCTAASSPRWPTRPRAWPSARRSNPGSGHVTVNLDVQYLRAGALGTVEAHGRVVRAGRSIVFAEAEVTGADGGGAGAGAGDRGDLAAGLKPRYGLSTGRRSPRIASGSCVSTPCRRQQQAHVAADLDLAGHEGGDRGELALGQRHRGLVALRDRGVGVLGVADPHVDRRRRRSRIQYSVSPSSPRDHLLDRGVLARRGLLERVVAR